MLKQVEHFPNLFNDAHERTVMRAISDASIVVFLGQRLFWSEIVDATTRALVEMSGSRTESLDTMIDALIRLLTFTRRNWVIL